MLVASTKTRVRPAFINAAVMFSEAKDLCVYLSPQSIQKLIRDLRSAQNDIIINVFSQSYSVRHVRAEHPFINGAHLFADSWPRKFRCD